MYESKESDGVCRIMSFDADSDEHTHTRARARSAAIVPISKHHALVSICVTKWLASQDPLDRKFCDKCLNMSSTAELVHCSRMIVIFPCAASLREE